jgi:glyoxylase-like metal-dependent hydrolase (beta-lactamase superfamily II)
MPSDLTLPAFKGSTVRVSALHGGRITMPSRFFFQKQILGHDLLDIPCYSFLIDNKRLGQKILYDLGLMKAWKQKQPPGREYSRLKLICPSIVLANVCTLAVIAQLKSAKVVVDIKKDVANQLTEGNVPLESINAIIWSHHHFDHTGDPSLFPKSTSLVIGPGFKSNKTTFPGYPKNPDALAIDDAFEGRELIELDFSTSENIGGFPAIDYFGDGSFYILQAQGHSE